MGFSSFGLNENLVTSVIAKGYYKPTPIQSEAIPAILDRQDVMAGAQTGTGKTAAFALPILHMLSANNSVGLKALILAPTRELAQQVGNNFIEYGKDTGLRTVIVYGGVSINTQTSELQKGVNILVATPGRLLDHIQKGTVSLELLEFLVFDEADRMLDMGFMAEINRILNVIPASRQTLLFSATLDDAIFKFGKTLLKAPKLIEVSERNATANDVEQKVYEVDKSRKREITSFLIGSNNWQQVLIFTRTKKGADTLAAELTKDGIKTQAIHGDKSQGARERGLEDFKSGKIRALVATDVASRGLDIQQLKHVINYELPFNAEDYIHRIGRTGRAGKNGVAITLLSADENWLLEEIHTLLDTQLLKQWLPGYEPDLNLKIADNKPRPGNRKKSGTGRRR